ncbi:MAG: hypothetical protein JOY51_06030, partial [Nevskia sp.]|nr:hypothetical protein [Nevskia sp.]
MTWRGGLLAILLILVTSALPSLAVHLADTLERMQTRPARHLDGEEARAIQFVNDYRRRYRLPDLAPDGRLHQAALSHSADMLLHDFFEVDSPRRGTHQYRIWAAGITDARVYCFIFKTNSA